MQFKNGRMFVPFNKIDKERRMVWGIAQSESPDCQDDLIDYEASVRAFSKWSGCIREMHDDKKAVGRKVEIKCDPVSKTIAVGAYISKGAEDTWQKCLDGTLNGYSIGGYPIKTGSIHKFGRTLRHLTEYGLDELSLVDQPANPDCTITAIQKRGTHLIATNILGALRPENKGMRKRSKIGSLVQFTKALGADDEVVVVRKTDFTRTQDGRYVLSKNASIAHFAKADLDSDGYDDAADDTAADETGPVSKADASGHAQNAMDSHDDWHKVAGQKECNCDRDDDAPEVKGKAEEGDEDPAGDDVSKSATRKRRRDALRKRTGAFTKADVEKTLTGMFAEFAKSFDEKFEKLGVSGESAPRKNGDGTLVKRDGADGDESDPIVLSKRNVDALHAKRDEFLKKGSKGLSDQDRSEREALAKEINNAEVTHLALTGAIAR